MVDSINKSQSNGQRDWGELIKTDGVKGSVYNDPEIFEEELKKIWYKMITHTKTSIQIGSHPTTEPNLPNPTSRHA